MPPVDRDEFNARFNSLDKRVDEIRTDVKEVLALHIKHESRISALEVVPSVDPPARRSKWASTGAGAGLGALIWGAGQYILSAWLTKGEPK